MKNFTFLSSAIEAAAMAAGVNINDVEAQSVDIVYTVVNHTGRARFCGHLITAKENHAYYELKSLT